MKPTDSIPKIKILNTEILSITKDELLKKLDKGVLITPNLDHLVKLQNDTEFVECYNSADWIVCDSRILYFCSKLLKQSLPEAIPGSSFFTSFYTYHKNNPDCRIFLLGGMNGVADKAMKRINEKIGREIIVGAHSPSYGFEKNKAENIEIHKIINQSGANVVLVGVGAPKQEKWIMANKSMMPGVDIWMALGATIDFEAGNIKRAPEIMQRIGLEWFYRFCNEPKRLFKRYFIDDMKFFYLFTRQLLGIYRCP